MSAERMAGLTRYMWPVRESASVLCMSATEVRCDFPAKRGLSYATACRRARKHTRDSGHDTRVRHERITEYSASGGVV